MCLQFASMVDVATLYVRDVPPELYEQLKAWAERAGRSVNAEVLALLEREAERRRTKSDWFREIEAFHARNPHLAKIPWEDWLREDRERGD
jgi:hypothetical protein